MAVLEVIVYALNETILVLELKIVDVGGSMIIHTFGAYFGLGVAWMTGRALYKGHKDNSSVYHANLFSFIGQCRVCVCVCVCVCVSYFGRRLSPAWPDLKRPPPHISTLRSF
jgi:hypothetical protein